MKRYIMMFAFLCVIVASGIARAQYFSGGVPTGLPHSYTSQRMDGEMWGLAYGDINGDGAKEIVLLKHDSVMAGSFTEGNFTPSMQYRLKGFLAGVRVFTMDLDGDGAEEIVVSAIENGHPSSLVLRYASDVLEPVLENAPWHLRVITKGDSKRLIGQQWNAASFFFGPIYELELASGKLKTGERIKLCSTTDIFDFDIISLVTDDITKETFVQSFAWIDGYEPLKIYTRKKKSFKRAWSTGVKFGGTMNLVEATQRETLGQAMDYYIQIDKEPEALSIAGKDLLFAVQHDIPLKNMIGRKPYIRSGKIVAFKNDPVLGFSKYFETEEVPGFIADFVVYEMEGAPKQDPKKQKAKKGVVPETVTQAKLIMLLQPDTSAFRADRDSVLLSFDIPQ